MSQKLRWLYMLYAICCGLQISLEEFFLRSMFAPDNLYDKK